LAQVKERRDRALREGRFMQGLEFAKQVSKAEPSIDNQEALFHAYLGRGRELRNQNKPRDAITTLQNAVGLVDADPVRLTSLAQELVACGEVRQALILIQRVPESTARQQVLIRAADAALQQEAHGRSLLPEELRGEFDRIIQTFAQLEAGRDDEARESIAGIGLRSPFLEWKLLLRGLQAYYQSDDVRAIENWQRLSAERLPARLAAPLRALIDAAYRSAQPPAAQTALRQQADRLQDQGLASYLRAIQADLARDGKLASAFRVGETLAPILLQQAPDLVPRLAACFYWTVISGGLPEDVRRYLKVFGPPPDDPHCYRLQALAAEHHHGLADAHEFWQAYEKFLAASPSGWPNEQAKRARALVWLRMGRNADSVPDTDSIPGLPEYLRNHPDRPRGLKPSADKCYQNSVKLAPEMLEAHEALFQYHRDRGEFDKAEKAARQLLQHFQEHGATLEGLGDLLLEQGRPREALELFERALRHHPLDRVLRAKISTAHVYHARAFAELSRFEEARAAYRAALEFGAGNNRSVLCKWAACEFKAGDAARAEELLAQTLQESGSRLAVAYSMLIECIRLKLARALKSRFDGEFKDALGEPPVAASVAAALESAAAHHAAGVTYHGQKSHEKKVLAYSEKARDSDFTEQQLTRMCNSLFLLKAIRPLRTFCRLGARRFSHAAVFPYLEAESYFVQEPGRIHNAWQATPLLEKAQRLASQMPPDERRDALLKSIGERQQMMQVLGAGPFGMFREMLDQFSGFADEDFDED
jgi:tetratricopeptide (TPR) repeat protein